MLPVVVWLVASAGGLAAVALDRVLPPMVAVVPGWGTVGMLLGLRRPQHPIGWILLGTASTPAISAIGPLPPEVQTGVLAAGVALVLVLFPTGSVPGRSWYVAIALLGISIASQGVLGAVTVGSFGVPVGVTLAAVALVWCAAAPVARTRSASPQERAQLRWLGLVAVAAGLAIVMAAIGLATRLDALLHLAGLIVVVMLLFGIPGAILLAVLRYRLYEIDRLVSRSLTFTVVVALVSAVYAIPTVIASLLVGDGNQLVTAGATLTAAAAVSPLRRRVHRAVERRFNRTTFDAAREMDTVGARVRDEPSSGDIARHLAGAVARTMQPRSISVWLHVPPPAGEPAAPRRALRSGAHAAIGR